MTAIVPVLSAIATWGVTWGPSLYYSLGIVNTLAMPSYIKHQGGPSALVKDVLPEVFEKVENLRKDIIMYRVPNLPHAAALGTNFGPAAVLLVNGELASIGDEALHYILKHELSHINTSDGFIASTLATILSAVSTYAMPYLQSCLPWWAAPISYFVPFFVGANTYNTAMLIFEIRADQFASRHATSEELVGIERFVRAEIEVNKTMQPKYPQLFTTDGNTRLALGDVTHGPLTGRLKEITSECRQKGIALEESDLGTAKMQQLQGFHRYTYTEFFKLKVD